MGRNNGVHSGLHKILRQVALHAAQQFLGQFGIRGLVGGELFIPGLLGSRAGGLGVPVCIHLLRDGEWRVAPAQARAGQRDFFGTQGFAMGLGRVGAVWAALADVGLADDQRGTVVCLFGFSNGGRDGSHVVAVDRANHIPAIGDKALGGVVYEPGCDLAVNRDTVVVIQGNQFAQLPGAGQGRGFVADAFHQAAIAHEHIGVVVDNAMVAVAVEFAGQQLFCQGHAHSIGQTLTQRAGGGFHTRGQSVFGVARCLAVHLAEVLQLGHRQLVTGEVQQRVNQHGAVAVG